MRQASVQEGWSGSSNKCRQCLGVGVIVLTCCHGQNCKQDV